MKKLKSIKGIPLSYIESVIKIDSTSPSGLTWLPREDVQFKYDNKNAGYKHTDQRKYQSWDISITHNDKKYNIKCSRVIFLLHNGYLTKNKEVDHKDGNSLNNKVNNLRESTLAQNQHNSKLRKNNTSGHKGVYWNKASGKWMVRINVNGKSYYFGMYVNKEDAIKVAIEARKKIHGEFGRNK